LLGPLSIAIWNDIVEDYDDEFNAWHTREHMPERIGIPGFLRGRRYEAIDAAIRYFTLYELKGREVLTGPDYKARLNAPTQWSKQSTAQFLNNYRGVCDIVVSRALQTAGNAIVTRLDLGSAPLDSTRLQAVAQDILSWDGVSGFHVMRCNRELSGTKTALQATRQIFLPETAVMIEIVEANRVASIADRWSETITSLWPGIAPVVDTYRLQCEIMTQPPAAVLETIHPKAWK
jgi:hypothetical protein